MKIGTYVRAVTFVSFLGCSAEAQTSSIEREATAITWTTANAARLHAVFKDSKAVADLENQIIPADDRDELSPHNVAEFRIVDLNNDGQLELIYTVDVTGRAFYTSLVVIAQRRGRLHRAATSTNGANMVDLGSQILDLKGDGRRQIGVPQLLGADEGVDPVPQLPKLFELHDGELVDVSRQLPEYFTKTLLPPLKAKLSGFNNEPKSTAADDKALRKKIAVVSQEIAIIERRYGK